MKNCLPTVNPVKAFVCLTGDPLDVNAHTLNDNLLLDTMKGNVNLPIDFVYLIVNVIEIMYSF